MELSRVKVATLTFGESLKDFFSDQKEVLGQAIDQNTQRGLPFGKIKSKLPSLNKKTLLKILGSVVIILAAALLLLKISGKNTNSLTGPNVSAQKSINLSKTFQFAGDTENNQPTTNFMNLTLTTVETTKQILIQGQPATAKGGKIFLIVNLEIDNSHNQKLFISPVDLIRLVDKSGKKFAPDVHNNQVSVEPISVKKTRVGFVIDDGTHGWKLQIGEVAGTKETIDLSI